MEKGGVDWQSELQDLVASAKSDEDRAATEAFAKALGPYFEDPTLLRTLLSKIQRQIDEQVNLVVAQGSFGSLEEVKAQVSRDIEVVEL